MMPNETLADRAAAQAAARRGDQPGTDVELHEAPALMPGDAAFGKLSQWTAQISQVLAPGHDVEPFIRMCAISLANSRSADKIARCTDVSIYNTVAQCAHYGLLPDGIQAAAVPFGKVLTFIPMYRGFIQLAANAGWLVTARLIYRKDKWGIEHGPQGRGFIHEPLLYADDGNGIPVEVSRGHLDAHGQPCARVDGRGNGQPGPGDDNPPILAYCYARGPQGQTTEVEIVTIQRALEIRDKYSKSWRQAETSERYDSTWHTHFDRMVLKSAVRAGMTWIPQSPIMRELLLADQASDSTIPGTAQPWTPPPAEFTPGGPAAAWEGDVRHGDGTVIPGTVEADTTGEPNGDPGSAGEAFDQAAPPPPTGPRAQRNTDVKRINELMRDAGLTDHQYDDARLLIIGAAAAGDQPPLQLRSVAALTAEQAATARQVLEAAHTAALDTAADVPVGDYLHGQLLKLATAQGWQE